MTRFTKKKVCYSESLKLLYSLTNYETVTDKYSQRKKNDPQKIAWLAKKTGILSEEIPSIHIVGTNGKGSTAAMISSILIEHGYKVGLFTSPHIHTIRERICFNNIPISKDDFVKLFSFVWQSIIKYHEKNNKPAVTVFEILTLMAFEYFRSKSVDYQIIEAGIGGNKDSTNIINAKYVILTSVGFDHRKILGNTLTKIAYDKLGVLNPKSTLVSSNQHHNVRILVNDICKSRDVNLVSVGKDIIIDSSQVKEKFQICKIQGTFDSYEIKVPLLGKHQVQNLATGIGLIEQLIVKGFKLNKSKLDLGLAKMKWPCRLELISSGPDIYVDGAHNPHSMRILADYFKNKKIIFIFGSSSTKEVKKNLDILEKINPILIITKSPHPRAYPSRMLVQIAKNMKFSKVIETSSVNEAIKEAKNLISPSVTTIVVGGSLFVAAAVRSIIKDIREEYPQY